MNYFLWGPFGQVEVDHRVIDTMLPRIGSYDHPDPQHWYDIRRLALERDKYRCVVCNSRERLEVHHRTYAHFGRELLYEVYTLCADCHDTFHKERGLAG